MSDLQQILIRVGFPGGSVVKNPPANAGDTEDVGSIPALGRSPGGGNGDPLQYSCLANPTGREAQRAPVHGVVGHNGITNSFTFHFTVKLGDSLRRHLHL